MKVNEIMTSNPEVIRPDATLQEAAQRMKDLDVGSLPVCDGRHLRGMITDRDIIVRTTAEGRDPRSTLVRDAMTAKVVYCFDDQDVREIAKVMQDEQIRRLPILDRDKMLVGIVSLGDISVDADMGSLSGSTLRDISKPSRPDR